MTLREEFKLVVLGLALVAGAAKLAGCTPPPPPPHNEYNITMDCFGRKTEHFEGVSLAQGVSLYHVRKYDVVNGNQLQLVFEKNFRKLGCTMQREAAAPPPAPVPAPSR